MKHLLFCSEKGVDKIIEYLRLQDMNESSSTPSLDSMACSDTEEVENCFDATDLDDSETVNISYLILKNKNYYKFVFF